MVSKHSYIAGLVFTLLAILCCLGPILYFLVGASFFASIAAYIFHNLIIETMGLLIVILSLSFIGYNFQPYIYPLSYYSSGQ